MKYPNFREEKRLWKKGYRYAAGLDEAGRGSLAGPVVAAAALIDLRFKVPDLRFLKGIRDSKKLTPKKREEFYRLLTNHPRIKWGIGRVSEKVIDKINIKNAAELAMAKSLKKLKVDFLIIDGSHIKNLKLKSYNFKLIPKADEKVFSCAAASIIAKVHRDRIMRRYDKKYSEYGFDKHKGYPTRLHLKTLRRYGPCKIHRKTFKPVKSCQNNDYLLS